MNYNICTYYVYLHYNCSFSDLNNFEILSKLRAEMLKTYPYNGIDVEIEARKGYAFQITNSLNQIISNESYFSNINLGDCESLLKETYGIDPSMPLIFLKFEKIASSGPKRDIQYQIFNPITYDQMNLSICENTKITLKLPIEVSEEVLDLIQNIKDQGYNPFDLNDKFYREICTPYNSENGTDVLLDDREEYIYSTIANETSCPSGCEMSSYSLDAKYITCECNVNDTGIVPIDLKHISGQNILYSFLSTLKNSNYKVMRCYNLVFNFKIFCHNYGSIITLIFFIVYVLFMIYYCFRDILPIKVSVSKLIFEEQQKYKNDDFNILQSYIFQSRTEKTKKSTITKKKKQSKNKKDNNPPKKTRVKRTYNNNGNNNNSFEGKKQKKALKIVDIMKKKRHSIKNLPQNDVESVKSDKVRKRKSIVQDDSHEKYDPKESPKKLKSLKDEKKEKIYDNFELNNMDYNDASEYDKRNCLVTYWSVLKREHYVIFTFCSRNDKNLFYIKIERFFILVCTEMTMNGMFFVHETMYKKQTGGITFAQKIPQFIFSLIVSHIIEVILCYLGMTDVNYYQIKELPQIQKNDERVFDILECMKKKLTAFFVFTFLVFLFHWYFISAFCAVYQNTQVIYLRDSAISILTSLIDPFIIYGFTCILRAISLTKCCRKKLGCVYKLSDLIPIF